MRRDWREASKRAGGRSTHGSEHLSEAFLLGETAGPLTPPPSRHRRAHRRDGARLGGYGVRARELPRAAHRHDRRLMHRGPPTGPTLFDPQP